MALRTWQVIPRLVIVLAIVVAALGVGLGIGRVGADEETPLSPNTNDGPFSFFVCPGCDLSGMADDFWGKDLTRAYLPLARFHVGGLPEPQPTVLRLVSVNFTEAELYRSF